MFGIYEDMPATCGVGIVFDYHSKKNDYSWQNPQSLKTCTFEQKQGYGGSGWLCAGFINDTVCIHAYKDLINSKRRLVFQSPIRYNKNSGNDFFFCIFDSRYTEKDIEAVESPGWPFTDEPIEV